MQMLRDSFAGQQRQKAPFTPLIQQQEVQNATIAPLIRLNVEIPPCSVLFTAPFSQKGSLCIHLGSKTIKYYAEVHQGKFPGRGLSV